MTDAALSMRRAEGKGREGHGLRETLLRGPGARGQGAALSRLLEPVTFIPSNNGASLVADLSCSRRVAEVIAVKYSI